MIVCVIHLPEDIVITTIAQPRLSAVLALLVAALISAAPARAQSPDDLYAKAKSEGAFAFYVGGPTAPWEARAKAFTEKYPGIKISVGGGFSNVLDQKIDQQMAANKLEVDAAILQTIADYVRWKREDRLMAFRPPGFDKMDAAFKDPDGTFWATMVNVVPYMYNTTKVAAAAVPNTALDFLKPEFHGKIVTPYPADDDVTLWVFYHIVQKYGWGYMDKYMAAKPNFIQGHLGEQRSIGTGQNLVTFDSILDITSGLKREGITTNEELSQKRADTVMQYLISQGVRPELVSAHGYGEADPVASNDTAQGRAQNRRVELSLGGPAS